MRGINEVADELQTLNDQFELASGDNAKYGSKRFFPPFFADIMPFFPFFFLNFISLHRGKDQIPSVLAGHEDFLKGALLDLTRLENTAQNHYFSYASRFQ